MFCTQANMIFYFFFFFQAEDGIRDYKVTGVQTCALPIWNNSSASAIAMNPRPARSTPTATTRRAEAFILSPRSEEHTSELQSPCNLVCRLLLEKKKKKKTIHLRSQTPKHRTRKRAQS